MILPPTYRGLLSSIFILLVDCSFFLSFFWYFFRDGVSFCQPGWNAAVWSQLASALNSSAQAISHLNFVGSWGSQAYAITSGYIFFCTDGVLVRCPGRFQVPGLKWSSRVGLQSQSAGVAGVSHRTQPVTLLGFTQAYCTMVVLWYPRGIGSRTLKDTKICRCSSTSYKMA